MSPNLRQAFHRALDIVLDALEDEAREEKPKRKRAVKEPELRAVSPEALEQAEKRWGKAGWRRSA